MNTSSATQQNTWKWSFTTQQGIKQAGGSLLVYAFFFVIGLIVFCAGPERSVSWHYENAANRWLSSEGLYTESMVTGQGFLYLPHAAILHIPFAVAANLFNAPILGDVLWRVTIWAVFAGAAWRFLSRSGIHEATPLLQAAILVCLPSISCLRIGQSTMLMAGLMLIATLALCRQREVLASAMVLLAIAVKPLAIVLALLMFAVFSKTRIPLVVGTLLMLLVPYAFQHPSYVTQQYVECITMLDVTADEGVLHPGAQFFGLLNTIGIAVEPALQTVIRIVLALATLYAVWLTRRRHDDSQTAVWLFTWTAVYLMLMNPRTENSTYCLVAPAYAYFAYDAFYNQRNWLLGTMIVCLTVFTAGSYEIGSLVVAKEVSTTWLAPLSCSLFAAYLIVRFAVSHRHAAQSHGPDTRSVQLPESA
ncbi:MAG TPA: hypothetical protein DDW52_25070 [Planctomycetaceae bacterium]|nr:hypothetical protein [Planctomycetaceae bacterium]